MTTPARMRAATMRLRSYEDGVRDDRAELRAALTPDYCDCNDPRRGIAVGRHMTDCRYGIIEDFLAEYAAASPSQSPLDEARAELLADLRAKVEALHVENYDRIDHPGGDHTTVIGTGVEKFRAAVLALLSPIPDQPEPTT